MMYANITESAATLKAQLESFMERHIYPNETVYHEQLAALPKSLSNCSTNGRTKSRGTQGRAFGNLFVPRDHGGLSNADYAPLRRSDGTSVVEFGSV